MPLQLRQWPVPWAADAVKKKNRRTFAIRRRFLRVLGDAAIIALSLVSVNSVHGEKKSRRMDIHPALRQLHTQVIIALSLVGRQPAAFAVPSRGFDLDQVERAFKPPSV